MHVMFLPIITVDDRACQPSAEHAQTCEDNAPSSADGHSSYRVKDYVVPVHHCVTSHDRRSSQQNQLICTYLQAVVNLEGMQKGLKKLCYLFKRNGCSPR